MNVEPEPSSAAGKPHREAAIESLFDLLAHKMETASVQAYDEWRSATTTQIIDPLRKSVTNAARLHSNLVDQLQSGDDPVMLEQVIVYRQEVSKQILQPLINDLARLSDPEVWNHQTGLMDHLSNIADQAPEQCTLPLPRSLYETGIDRNWHIRKFLHRSKAYLTSWVRKALQKPPKESTRTLPLRLLFQYHAQVRIANIFTALYEEWEQHAARLIRQFESTFFEWTNTVLMLEHGLEGNIKLDSPLLSFIQNQAFPEGPPSDRSAIDDLLSEVCSLQKTFEQIVSQAVLPNAGADLALQQHNKFLLRDFNLAGTVFLKHSKRKLPEKSPQKLLGERQTQWAGWREQALNQMNLCVQTLRLRNTFVSVRLEILRHVADSTLAPVWDSFESAAVLLEDCLNKGFDRSAESLYDTFTNLQTDVLKPIHETLSKPPNLASSRLELQNSLEPKWTILNRLITELPESVVLHVLSPTAPLTPPNQKKVHRTLRKDLQRIFIPLSEQLPPRIWILHQNLISVWERAGEVTGVMEFSISAALAELEDPADGETTDRAKTLVQDGLGRAASILRKLLTSLDPSWHTLVLGIFAVLGREWQNLYQSIQSVHQRKYYWLGLRYRIRHSILNIHKWLRILYRRIVRLRDMVLLRGQQRATTLIKHGRIAVGTAAPENESIYAIQSIGANAIRELHARFPLVYHRLFDLDVLSEPSLFVGRDADLKHLNLHVKWWTECRAGGALILPMAPGSGMSSLLRALGSELKNTVHTVFLTSRLHHIDEFSAVISSAMGIQASSIDELETRILESPPQICLVDNLEYCMLRAYRGAEILERALLFFARTDTCVCWIATINHHAWQYIKRAIPNSVNLVSAYQATPINQTMLSRIITTRHRHSGIPLNFEKPATIPPLLSRKLRRDQNTDAGEKVLRDHFFDRLFHHCGSNVRLALVTWLRAAKFSDNHMTIRESPSPNFDFLQSLNLASRFAMKAFLMHATLSPKEYHQVFALTPNAAGAALQTLRNLNVIIPCGMRLTDLDQASNGINHGARYQLHPLLLFPVTRLLRQENIVH